MNRPTKTTERIFLSPPHMSGKELEYVKQAFESNYIAPIGPQLNQFEDLFKTITGFKHCVAVSNGTSAIHLALRAIGVGPGDTVLASTLTFMGSVSPIIFQGANPVFIDCDEATWNMDVNLLAEEIERLVAAGTKPKAVVPTDLYGQSCDITAIKRVCDVHDIPVIIDSAESMGATYQDKHAGRGTKAAAFSFNGNKIITTSSGGMLASDDRDLIEYCRHLSTQARQPVAHYEHTEVGYNYRMSNVIAAIGIGQLEALDERVKRRREIFDQYSERLSDLPGITMMPEARFGSCNRWLTVAQIDEAKFGKSNLRIIDDLEQNNIEARPVWKPMHLQPVFAECRVVGGAVSEKLFGNGICLPSGTAMTEQDIDRICEIIKTT